MLEKLQHSSSADNGSSDAPSDARSRIGFSRTIAAGRQFLRAVRSDLWKLTRYAASVVLAVRRQKLPLAASRHRTPSGLALALLQLIAVIAGLSAAVFTTAMVWALRDLPPLAKPIGETEAPSLLLQVANGNPLGRVGTGAGPTHPFTEPMAVQLHARRVADRC